MAGKVGRSGRTKGTPNKTTLEAREAIGRFVDGNAGRLQGWLDQIADGVRDEETGEYLVAPNPEKAFVLFNGVIEYHVPKLARSEVNVSGDLTLTDALRAVNKSIDGEQ